jgi:hypothetical protein
MSSGPTVCPKTTKGLIRTIATGPDLTSEFAHLTLGDRLVGRNLGGFFGILKRRSSVSGPAASDRIVAFSAYPVMHKIFGTDRRRYTPSIISRIFAAR